MSDLNLGYHQAVQTDRHRQGRVGELRRRALVQRRARRRLAKAQRTALQARLILAADSDGHALVPRAPGA